MYIIWEGVYLIMQNDIVLRVISRKSGYMYVSQLQELPNKSTSYKSGEIAATAGLAW